MEKQLFITRKDNKKLAVKIFIPDGEILKKYPAVIISHGFNACYRDLEHHGPGYAENGIVCVMFDFMGGSTRTMSDGKLSDMTVLTEVEDLLEIIGYVKELEYVDANKVFLIGESMGGFVTTYVAAKYQEVEAIILWYPAFCIPDDSKVRLENRDNTCFGLDISEDFNATSANIDIYEKLAEYRKPVLIIHGDKDPVVALSYSEKAKSVGANSRLIVIPGAGHGFDGSDSEFARNCTIKFINENLVK